MLHRPPGPVAKSSSAFLRLSPPFPRLHAGLIEPPPSSRGTSTRINQPDFFQHLQVVAERPRGWRLGEPGEDLSKTPPLPVTQHLEDLSLPIRQIVTYPQRRVVSGREESDDDRTGLLLELGLRLADGHAPSDDFLGASTPLLDQPSTVEDPGDQRVAEAGGVVPLEVGHGDSRRQEPQAGDFQPVIENGNEDGSPGDRIYLTRPLVKHLRIAES